MLKRILSILLMLALAAAACLSLTSCRKSDEDGSTADDGKTVTLYVYNWGEYISDGFDESINVNEEFEQYCRDELGMNVKVNYSTFSSNEDMYARISSGAARYDVIIPSDYMIQRMIGEDRLLPLDTSKIENYRYISDDFKGENVYYEPNDGNIYSIPYFYGMIGVIYNTEYVGEDEEAVRDQSWKLLFDVDKDEEGNYISEHKGDILQFNNPRDAFGTALYYLGYDVNEATEEQWREALDLLKEQKNIVQGYVMDEIFNKMKSGSAAIAAYYAGDFLSMYEDNDSLDFFYPSEGTNYYVDAMCIPKNAYSPELAQEYINFMCRPDIALANAEYTYYASPLNLELIEEEGEYDEALEEYRACMEEVREDAMEILYGETAASVREKSSAYLNLEADKLDLLNDLWEELKIESSVSVGIYVIIGVILAALIALAVWYFVRKRLWAKLYD